MKTSLIAVEGTEIANLKSRVYSLISTPHTPFTAQMHTIDSREHLTPELKVWLAALIEWDGTWGIYPYISKGAHRVNFRLGVNSANGELINILCTWYRGYKSRGICGYGITWQDEQCMQVLDDILPYTTLATQYFTHMKNLYHLYTTKDHKALYAQIPILPQKREDVGFMGLYQKRMYEKYLPYYIGGIYDARGQARIDVQHPKKSRSQIKSEIRISCRNTFVAQDLCEYFAQHNIRTTVRKTTLLIWGRKDVLRTLEQLTFYTIYKKKYLELILTYRHFFLAGSLGREYYYLIKILQHYWKCLSRGDDLTRLRSVFSQWGEGSEVPGGMDAYTQFTKGE